MKNIYKWVLLFLVATCIAIPQAKASHAMGADLTYNCLGGNQYRVRLSFYRDCAGITPLTSYSVSVNSTSCGQSLFMTLNQLPGYPIEVSPLCPTQLNQSTCSGGTLPGVQQYVFEGNITLPMACNDWVFSWNECCRNSSITTLTSPGSEGMTIWANLNNVAAPCNNSPDFTTFPVPYVCVGQSYVYNHGAIDPDGDSLSYSLVNAMNTATIPVVYNAPFSGTNPLASTPAVTINPLNGNVTMNPTVVQVGVITVLVQEYRGGVLIGSVMRDIQVTVLNCTNNPPTINPITGVTGGVQTGPYSVQVCPGQALSFQVPGTDPNNGQTITMTWNNGIPGATFTGGTATAPTGINGTFNWTPTGGDVGINALTISLNDNACPVIGQATMAISIEVLQGTTAGPNVAYCTPPGTGAQLNATGGTSFTWNVLSGSAGSLSCTNCANPIATPSVVTTYQVVSNLASGCRNRDTIVVTPTAGFNLTPSPNATICQGGSGVISVTPSVPGTYTYSWSPSTGLSSTTIANPTATPPATTTYTCTVTSAGGCTRTASVTLTMTNYQLTAMPTATPPQGCQGAPITLAANVSSNSCSQYTLSSITLNPAGGGGWTSIGSTMGDELVSGSIPLGFNFTFSCSTYTSIVVSPNGFISFDPVPGTGCCSGQLLPSTTTPNNLIALAWDDLVPGANNSVRYKVNGAAPNRVFILHFNGLTHFGGGGGNVDGQIMLYETTNVIELHLSSMTTDGSPHTQGIENAAGTVAVATPGRNANSAWSSTGDAYRFTPVPPPPVTITWQAPLGTTIGTGSTLVTTPTANTTYYANVTDGVCSTTGQVTVPYTSINAGPDQIICPNGTAALNAIYTGPPPVNNCNVYLVNAIPYAPVAGAGTTVTLFDDQISPAIPIGFNFNFYCSNYSTIYISSNGFLTFNAASGAGCCSGGTIPTSIITNFIAGAWNDLYPPGGGFIDYFTTGTAPNRKFVVNYNSISHCCTSGPPNNTFQIVLCETTNYIEVHSNNITNDGSTCTEGIGDITGTLGVAAPGRNSTLFTATNDAYRFYPQVIPVNYTWTPATYLNSTTVPNPTASPVASSITYTITVSNGTCTVSDQVFISTSCILGASLLDFSGQKEGETSHLYWSTSEEPDVDYFVLERSLDGLSFNPLGNVSATGSPTYGASYDYVDGQPQDGINYYRLRIFDRSGNSELSNVVQLHYGSDLGNALIKVFPNPTRDQVNFEIALQNNSPAIVRIFSANGSEVAGMSIPGGSGGTHTAMLNLSNLAPATYLYEVKAGDKTFTGKLVLER